MNLDNFDWGCTHDSWKAYVTEEVLVNKTYEQFFKVEENDIVVDLGASVGDFIWSVKDSKFKHCWVVEPLDCYFDSMLNNLMGMPVSFVKAAVSSEKCMDLAFNGEEYSPRVITFREFLSENNIKHIDFLKVDCEGGEYDVFSSEHLPFLKTINKIVVEFHLNDEIQKAKFKKFRNEILSSFENFNVLSVDGVDIKWDLHNQHFIDYYKQVIIYIDNRQF